MFPNIKSLTIPSLYYKKNFNQNIRKILLDYKFNYIIKHFNLKFTVIIYAQTPKTNEYI
jgi:late competence protein required for DNA uptake (superfamily II DNA/RNA helicase)